MLVKLRSAIKIAVINILIFLAIFLALETSIRLKSLILNDVPFFGNRTFVSPWFTTLTKVSPEIEQDGKIFFKHRKSPTEIEKKPGITRIIAVGGSTTENNTAYVKAKIDYASVLENSLNKRYLEREFEVLNAGTAAFSSAHSLVNIALRLVDFNPDVIILMHNANDSSVNLYKPGTTGDYSNKYMKPYYLTLDIQSTLSIRGFLLQFRLLRKLGVAKLFHQKADDTLETPDYQKGLSIFKRNLEMINSICVSRDIKLILLSQPRIDSTQRRYARIQDESFYAYNKAIADVSFANNIQFIDMHKKLGQNEIYFSDGLHYTPKGIHRFSQILFEELKF